MRTRSTNQLNKQIAILIECCNFKKVLLTSVLSLVYKFQSIDKQIYL